jgi:hypothetical protein
MIINKNKRLYIYLFCVFTLFVSLILGENSSGGSKIDSIITLQFVENFNYGFLSGLDYFISTNQIHSPIFYFLLSKSISTFGNYFSSLLYILISSLIPLIFYKILKKKFLSSKNKNSLFAISLIIFLSPYFRSSCVWITNDNLALLFILVSMYFLICSHIRLTKKNYYYFLGIIFLIIGSYIRQNYAFLFVFYIIKGFEILDRKTLLYLIFLSFLLSLPAFLYIEKIYSADSNVFAMRPNYLNNLFIYLSIISFYFFPFFLAEKNIFKYKNIIFNQKQESFILSIIAILLFYFNDSDQFNFGGGVILKLSAIFEFMPFLLLSSILGIFLITYYYRSIKNLSPLILIFFSFPFPILYQKYFDPILVILLLILSGSEIIEKNLKKNNFNINFLLFYFTSFLIFSNYYYLTN